MVQSIVNELHRACLLVGSHFYSLVELALLHHKERVVIRHANVSL